MVMWNFQDKTSWKDYSEIFSPVAMLKSIRILLSIAAVLGTMRYGKMDVEMTFSKKS